MLDISIKALDKVITSKKKAFDFIKKRVRAVEKIDGTKLTLIRNDEPFDPADYTKNWIVSYKGRIIYPTEFKGLEERDPEIRAQALGTSQYKFVHDHLRRVHRGTASVPPNTEFFIEFVQNKPTVTRDYGRKHGLFLVGFGETKHAVSWGHIYSSASFENSPELIKKYCKMLQLGEFPVIFEGNFSSKEEILAGCIDPGVKQMFEAGFPTVDFSDPTSIIELVTLVFSRLQSSLGGQAEGVVLQVGGDDISSRELYKVLAADQHSKTVRGEKKARYKAADEVDEEKYRREVATLANSIMKTIPEGDLDEMLADLSSAVYGLEELPFHPVKSKINIQEDILLTAKLGLLYAGTNEAQKIAIIPMAAKPFHAGHDSLIKRAFEDGCQAAIVFLSTGGRDEISAEDMIPLWRRVYIPGISRVYGKNVSIRFTDSPVRDAALFAKNFAKNEGVQVLVYGGVDGEGSNEAQQRVDMILAKNPELSNKITPVGVSRSETGGISGTAMRGFVTSDDFDSFINNLPSWLDAKDRRLVWDTLRKVYAKGASATVESFIRKIVKESLGR
jgi:hypothetical protein